MNITAARVTRVDDPHLKAVVSLTLDGCFVIQGFRIVEHNDALLVEMPTTTDPRGQPFEYVLPADPDTRSVIEDIVIRLYREGEDTDFAGGPAPLFPTPPALHANGKLPDPFARRIKSTDTAIGYLCGFLRGHRAPNA